MSEDGAMIPRPKGDAKVADARGLPPATAER